MLNDRPEALGLSVSNEKPHEQQRGTGLAPKGPVRRPPWAPVLWVCPRVSESPYRKAFLLPLPPKSQAQVETCHTQDASQPAGLPRPRTAGAEVRAAWSPRSSTCRVRVPQELGHRTMTAHRWAEPGFRAWLRLPGGSQTVQGWTLWLGAGAAHQGLDRPRVAPWPFAGVPNLLTSPVELKKPHVWVLAPPSLLNRFELWLWHQDFLNLPTDYNVPAELETTPAAS